MFEKYSYIVDLVADKYRGREDHEDIKQEASMKLFEILQKDLSKVKNIEGYLVTAIQNKINGYLGKE